MLFDGKSKRLRERLELSLPVRVHGRESLDYEWVEMTRLLDVTPFGARFSLSRPSETGRLLHLTLAMPRQLRCFDHLETQYRLWTLVRHVKPVETKGKDGIQVRFEIGVAFAGKRPPTSFETDPTTRYEIRSTSDLGLWSLQEKENPVEHVRRDEPRPETRHQLPIEVVVEILDEKGQVAQREETVTENISSRGAAVFTTLKIERGRYVRLTSARYGISVFAAVRAARLGADGIPRLHLEFVDQRWPLESI